MNWLILIQTPETNEAVHCPSMQECIDDYKEQVIDKGFTADQLGDECGQIQYLAPHMQAVMGTLQLDGTLITKAGQKLSKDTVEFMARPAEL